MKQLIRFLNIMDQASRRANIQGEHNDGKDTKPDMINHKIIVQTFNRIEWKAIFLL
jgi:hypothetical protein